MQQRDPIGSEVAVHAGGEKGRRGGGRDRRRRRRGRLVPLGHLHLVEGRRRRRLRLQLRGCGVGVARCRRQGRPGWLVDVGRRGRVRRLAVVGSTTNTQVQKLSPKNGTLNFYSVTKYKPSVYNRTVCELLTYEILKKHHSSSKNLKLFQDMINKKPVLSKVLLNAIYIKQFTSEITFKIA